MQNAHDPRVIDVSADMCVVECPQCRSGRAADVPIGIGLRMRDRITAELLAENHRTAHRSLAVVGGG
jgi:hypothetical protein